MTPFIKNIQIIIAGIICLIISLIISYIYQQTIILILRRTNKYTQIITSVTPAIAFICIPAAILTYYGPVYDLL